MAEFNQALLQDVFMRLREAGTPLAAVINNAEIGQEILDFLAMLNGIKPHFLLGRGIDHPDWVNGVTTIARAYDLTVIEGPFWDATPFGGFPDWYADHNRAVLAPFRGRYICGDASIAQDIKRVCDAGGRIAMTEEARLLGYPDCCVVSHYERAVRYHKATFSILTRLGNGDETTMRNLLVGGAALSPQTDGEIADMEAAFDLHPARYGSWNMCSRCAQSGEGPSARLSLRYYALAVRVDPSWVVGETPSVGPPPRSTL